MKKRPIIFSAEMVRAILDGRKTQTRRVIKPQPTDDGIWPADWSSTDHCGWQTKTHAGEIVDCNCPYGQPGDRLWVRETWVELAAVNPDGILTVRPGDNLISLPEGFRSNDGHHRWSHFSGSVISYRADGEIEFCDGDGFSGEWADRSDMPRWKPSIHMPRWASRITLEVVNVRVERVWETSEADAVAEGVKFVGEPDCWKNYYSEMSAFSALESFRTLWSSIYAPNYDKNPSPYCWGANPWVWVIEFRRVD